MREQERAPRKYELMTILHPEVAEEALPGELDRIAGYIADAGGELLDSLRESPWGRRRLAYPIRSGGKDVRDGYYTVWHFSIGPTRLTDLERELKLNTQVIRYLVVSWEPKPLTAKELEAQEIAAEEAAAAEYAAAQTAAAAAESAAQAPAAAEASAAEPAEESGAAPGLVAQVERAEALTAAAEAAEASGAELAIEPVEESAQAIEPIEAVAEREELEEEAAAALAKAAAAATEAEAAADAEAEIPAGAIRGTESGECPDDYPVKGNASSMLYHTPGSPAYKRTIPEYCFASVEAAEAAGFGPTKYEAAQEQDQAQEEEGA